MLPLSLAIIIFHGGGAVAFKQTFYVPSPIFSKLSCNRFKVLRQIWWRLPWWRWRMGWSLPGLWGSRSSGARVVRIGTPLVLPLLYNSTTSWSTRWPATTSCRWRRSLGRRWRARWFSTCPRLSSLWWVPLGEACGNSSCRRIEVVLLWPQGRPTYIGCYLQNALQLWCWSCDEILIELCTWYSIKYGCDLKQLCAIQLLSIFPEIPPSLMMWLLVGMTLFLPVPYLYDTRPWFKFRLKVSLNS